MKKTIFSILLLIGTLSLGNTYRNGLYRGVFVSGQETQVEVQFKLKDNIINDLKYRTLFYKNSDYLKEDKVKGQKENYENVLKALEGKNVDEILEKLYKPEDLIVAGASVRGSKIRAAIKNALNTGVYKPE